MKTRTILMLGVIGIGAAAHAAVITASGPGQINASATWGGATLPTAGDTDTWNTAGFNMNYGDETFYGGLLTVTGGSLLDGAAGADLFLQATTFDGGGIRKNGNVGDKYNFSGKALTFGSGGAAFSSNNQSRNITLQNGVWAGSGAISYTKSGTQGAGQSRLIVDTDNTLSGYTGVISVNNTSGIGTARLTIGAATTGSFGVNVGTGSVLDAIDMTLSSLVLGGETIAADTYAYSDFSVAQQAFLQDGGGEITVIPEPATLGLITAFGGAILFIRRRFMI